MYYEEAEVKRYFRKNKKGEKNPYCQIGIKQKSKFNVPMKIALVDIEELKKINESSDINKFNELQANYNKTSEELTELKQELQQYKATVESLTSDVKSLKEEKLQLQEDLLTEKNKHEEIIEAANNNIVEAKDKIVKIQKEHKEEISVKDSEIAELNLKLNNEKDYSKALLVVRSDFLKQNAIKRLLKVEPESSKMVAELKPKELETNISKE